MLIEHVRDTFGPRNCLSRLTIGRESFACDVLEDVDRGLLSTHPLDFILAHKVYGATAIPYGEYDVAMVYSPHFGRLMPHIMAVPGFTLTMYHWGNSRLNTLGCPLVGQRTADNIDWVGNSRATFELFLTVLLRGWESNGRVRTRITKYEPAPFKLSTAPDA